MLLITAIVPNEELLACKTITNSSPFVISGVIVVSQYRKSFPSDCTLRNSISSLDTLVAELAYVTLTAKYVKAAKFICKHADLSSSETGGKYTSTARSLSKSSEDFWIVSDKSKLQSSSANLLRHNNTMQYYSFKKNIEQNYKCKN